MATPALAPNRKIAGYLLLEKLGTGGLGEVWKARDPRLNRVVALKFITVSRPGSVPSRELLAEARAASALNHPNIVTIFELGETEGAAYLAMEYVDGETLRTRLRRAPFTPAEAADIAMQIAGALAVAHQHGIIHRDLKPENIMLRVDGYVKLVDFGLAKKLPWAQAAESSIVSGATQTGQVVGTFQYMSPEQARGLPVTPASDVFSLGIVLYEMLTGAHPFDAPSVMDTLTAILNKEPAKVSDRCPTAPAALVAAVERALSKDPQARFATAREMLEGLRHSTAPAAPAGAPVHKKKSRVMLAVGVAVLAIVLGGGVLSLRFGKDSGVGGPQVQSVAVLQLRTRADDPNAAAVSDGLAEDLGTALLRNGMQVASRSAVLALGSGGDARTIGGQLAVDAILEGDIRSAGDRFRVHLELVSTRTGFQVWSGNFVVDAQDLLNGAEKPAADIATQLRSELLQKR